MFRKIISKTQFLSIFFAVLFVSVFALPQKSLAERQDFKETCNNQDNCPGFCSCELKFLREGGTTQKFFLYNSDQHLVSTNTDGGITWQLYVKFDSQSCGISTSSSTNQIANFTQVLAQTVQASQRCEFKPAFCCCKVDDTGKRSGCRRYVDRDPTKNFAMTCGALGSDYKPTADPQLGAGCGLLNNSNSPRGAEDTTSNINLRDEVRGLNQLSSYSSVNQIIAQIIKVLLAFIGSIALFLYVWAGLIWMTAAGSGERITKAKSIMVWTTLGVAMMLGSYVIVTNLFDLLSRGSIQ
jgi:hypothetical protein